MIAVVGGGITGLALGRELTLRGLDCRVFEARDEPGGVIRSAWVGRHLLDWGPQRARLTGPMARLIEELGLEDEVVVAPGDLDLFVYRGRLRRVPFSVGAFLRTDLLSLGGKARAVLEPLTGGARDDEAVARLFARKFGREMYENLLGPLYGGLYASDPADMVVGTSLGRVLGEFRVGRSLLLTLLRRGGRIHPPPPCTFRDGMQSLPIALAGSLGDRVELDSAVTGISGEPGAWRVEGDGGAIDAEHVVLTVPAGAAARLMRGVAPTAAERIAGLRYNPLGVVHLEADTTLRGMGFQVSFAEDRPLKGVTFNDSLFGGGEDGSGAGDEDGAGDGAGDDGRSGGAGVGGGKSGGGGTGGQGGGRSGLYTAYLGGASHPQAVDQPDDVLAELAASEFCACTGFEARPISVARESMPAWDRSWSALPGLKLPAGLHLAANWESRPGLPGRLARARELAEALAAER